MKGSKGQEKEQSTNGMWFSFWDGEITMYRKGCAQM